MRFTETWCLGCSPPWLPPETCPPPRPAPRRPSPLREQVFGIALVSDFFMLVTGIAGSCFYCKWERRSRSTMRCTLWVPCALCNALCTPARGIGCDCALRRARWSLSSPHASAPLPRMCRLLTTPCQPSTLHPSDLQAEGRVRGCRQERRRNDTLFEQRQEVWQEESGTQGAYPRNTADQRAQRAVTPLVVLRESIQRVSLAELTWCHRAERCGCVFSH